MHGYTPGDLKLGPFLCVGATGLRHRDEEENLRCRGGAVTSAPCGQAPRLAFLFFPADSTRAGDRRPSRKISGRPSFPRPVRPRRYGWPLAVFSGTWDGGRLGSVLFSRDVSGPGGVRCHYVRGVRCRQSCAATSMCAACVAVGAKTVGRSWASSRFLGWREGLCPAVMVAACWWSGFDSRGRFECTGGGDDRWP